MHIPQHIRCFFLSSSFSFFRSLKPDDYLRLVDRGGACVCVCATMACAEHTKQEKREKSKPSALSIYICLNVKKYRAVEATCKPKLNSSPRTILSCVKIIQFVQYCVSRCTLRTWVIRFIYKRNRFSRDLILDTQFKLNAASMRFACLHKWFVKRNSSKKEDNFCDEQFLRMSGKSEKKKLKKLNVLCGRRVW